MTPRSRILVSALMFAVAFSSAGRPLLSQSVDPLDASHLPRLTLTELARVGGTDEREAYMLTSVSAGAVVGPDAFAVADAGSKQVRVFGTDGLVRRVLGREGNGPGEFKNLRNLAALPDGSLVVWDVGLRRATTFGPDGEVASTATLANSDVAVGTPVARGPPHRTRRAGLPHRAPTSGPGIEAVGRPGLLDAGLG